ncbi:hypothetical protein ACWDTI_04345 [Gordonia sp. NPDC003424]
MKHYMRNGAGRSTTMKTTLTSAVLVASIATGLGAGAAVAAPEQGGTNPNDTAPQQGGTTPDQSAPQQGGTAPTPELRQVEPAAPVYVPGPGTIPAPPQEAPYQPYTQQDASPNYQTAYNPVPEEPLTVPKPVAPVRPIAPPRNMLRVGNWVSEKPTWLTKNDVNSINAWSAYGEAKIAQGLISVGVPKDEASRRAASTIIGVMSGGTAGAAALGIPAIIPGALVGAGIGAVAGAGIGAASGAISLIVTTGGVGAAGAGPAALAAAGPGALIGAGIGAVVGGAAAGAVAGTVGAVVGGTLGGGAAYALGAGDPGTNPQAPWLLNQTDPQTDPSEPTGPNQFRITLPADQASKAGLPAVDYVVNSRGDVHAETQIGERTLAVNWDAGRAQAPYRALGPVGDQAQKSIREATKQATKNLQRQMPNVQVTWAPAAG